MITPLILIGIYVAVLGLLFIIDPAPKKQKMKWVISTTPLRRRSGMFETKLRGK